jgi:hypothetical protein
MEPDDISITEVEHEDGSVLWRFEMSAEYTKYFAKIGIVKFLQDVVAAAKEDIDKDD